MNQCGKWKSRSVFMCSLGALLLAPPLAYAQVTEAPTGFGNLTNGFTSQTTFEEDLDVFAEVEEIDDGLGPVYNAASCGACHANPVIGGISQITELRKGAFNGAVFTDPPGGSLNNDRAIDASIQERVHGGDNVTSFRTSLNTLGDGFLEAVGNSTLAAIQAAQPAALRGSLIAVPVLEANNALRFGHFGWKNQQASLVSFSADAYLNEMGITSPLQPTENTSDGDSVAAFDEVADPEDDGEDVEIFARFMRATEAPEPVPFNNDAAIGEQIFLAIGCNFCHVPTITTVSPGTLINGGAFTVPAALGNKRIHPYSDMLMHDVGTGDGIVQNGGQGSRNQLRTPPLWGMRTRDRLMHDGESLLRNDAILRHGGQAAGVRNNYNALSVTNKNRLIEFLNSI